MQRSIALTMLMAAPWITAEADGSRQMPEWLNPFPAARDEVRTSSAVAVDSSYLAAAPLDSVAAYYEEQLKKANAPFRKNSDGIGVSIRVSLEHDSCVVRITEAEGGSRVTAGCAFVSTQREEAFATFMPPPLPAPAMAPESQSAAASPTAPLKLEWPSWLEAPPNGRVSSPEKRLAGKAAATSTDDWPSLQRIYRSGAEMSAISQHYDRLLKENGYAIRRAAPRRDYDIETGQPVGIAGFDIVAVQHPAPNDPAFERQIQIAISKEQVLLRFWVKNGK